MNHLFASERIFDIAGFVNHGAIEVLSSEESHEFRKRHPERCVPTQFVERWKVTDDGAAKPKSRVVLIGWKDLDIFQLQRSAPVRNGGSDQMLISGFGQRKL